MLYTILFKREIQINLDYDLKRSTFFYYHNVWVELTLWFEKCPTRAFCPFIMCTTYNILSYWSDAWNKPHLTWVVFFESFRNEFTWTWLVCKFFFLFIKNILLNFNWLFIKWLINNEELWIRTGVPFFYWIWKKEAWSIRG